MADHIGHVRAALGEFSTPAKDGTRSFVTQMLHSGATDDPAVLAHDAVGAALAFGVALANGIRD